MEKFYFFDSNTAIGDRRLYSAADWSKVLSKFLENGIYVEGDNLTVTADGTAMAVTVGTGVAFIDGHMYESDTPLTLNVDAAEATLDRIDLVVLRLDITEQNRYIRTFVVKGEAAAAPVAPVPSDTTFIKEIPLAEIRVTAGKSIVEQTQITDRRSADFVEPFSDGSRITYLETVLSNLLQDDIGAYNKTESDNKYLTKTGASAGYVPYTGAKETVALNQPIELVSHMELKDHKGDNIVYKMIEDSATGRFEIRKYAEDTNNFLDRVLQVTPSGIMIVPFQPHTRIYNGSDFQVANSIESKMTGFSESYDSHDEFSPGLSAYIPKETGVYLLSAELLYTAINPQITYLRLFENGLLKDYIFRGFNNRFINGTLITKLIAGQTYEFYLYQNSGSTFTIDNISIGITKLS